MCLFWYYISAFCAVYKNTQIFLIKDSMTSLLMSLLYPFGLYLIPSYLRILSLSSNKIHNIDVLERVNFKELKELYLNGNEILDINVLEKVNFKRLDKLYLNGNRIFNFDVLEKENFKKLKELIY